MRSSFLPFSQPSVNQADIDGVIEVLKSRWITTGSKASEFEQRFKDYVGAESSVVMNSETSIILSILKILGIGPGDEVITPSLTWVSLPNMVELLGAKPVFVDCDRETLLADASEIEDAITPRTKLIVPVHFAGVPFDIDAIDMVSEKHNVPVVQDAAHALGADYKNRKIGSSGNCMFSFHPIKNITTGEGGMFVGDALLSARLRSFRFHGLGVDAYDRQTGGRVPQAQVLEPGCKFNMPDILASLGLSQLKRLDEMNKKRAYLAELYDEKFTDVPEVHPLLKPEYSHRSSNHLYVVRMVSDRLNRDEFMEALKVRNIGTGLHFRCVHKMSYYQKKYGFRNGVLPNSEWNADRICSLPLFPDMTEEDVCAVVNAVKEVLVG